MEEGGGGLRVDEVRRGKATGVEEVLLLATRHGHRLGRTRSILCDQRESQPLDDVVRLGERRRMGGRRRWESPSLSSLRPLVHTSERRCAVPPNQDLAERLVMREVGFVFFIDHTPPVAREGEKEARKLGGRERTQRGFGWRRKVNSLGVCETKRVRGKSRRRQAMGRELSLI